MPRFFVPAPLPVGTTVLTGENAAHAKVMRLRQGDRLTLCDGAGQECEAVIESLADREYHLNLSPAVASKSEPFCRVSVYMAYAKSDKIDHVVQKATELGAHEIVIFPSARCVSRPDKVGVRSKLERWQRIARSAAEQSGRGIIPMVSAEDTYEAALNRAAGQERFLFLYENEHKLSFRAALGKEPQSLAIMSGPEGGFEMEEVSAAISHGAQVCTLGPRILRCETAPLCALTAALFACGEYD